MSTCPTMEIFQLHLENATQANVAHKESIQAAKHSIVRWFAIGEFLHRQKESLDHGQWLPWLEKHIEFSQRQVSTYMTLHENRHKLEAASNLEQLSQRQMLELCDKPERKPRKPQKPEVREVEAKIVSNNTSQPEPERKSWAAPGMEGEPDHEPEPEPEPEPKQYDTAHDYVYNSLVPAIHKINQNCETFPHAWQFAMEHLKSIEPKRINAPVSEPEDSLSDEERAAKRERWRRQHSQQLYGNGARR